VDEPLHALASHASKGSRRPLQILVPRIRPPRVACDTATDGARARPLAG
jgi:hypothetical protein